MKSKIWILTSLLLVAGMLLGSCAPKATPTPVVEPTKAPESTKAVETQPPLAPVATDTSVPEPTATMVAPPPVEVKPGQTKIVIFVGFGTGTSPEQQPIHEQIQNEFNASHTDIQVEYLIVPYEERITKFSTMLAGDMAPDIVMPIGVGGIAEFYDEWIDLTPFIQADNYDMTRFIGLTTKIHQYPDKGILGLPMCVYPSVVYYNSDLFDAANVDYPPHKFGEKYADGSPWTYDKLAEIARKITVDANGNNADSPAFDPENIKVWGFDGWDWWSTIGDFAQQFGPVNGTGVSDDKKKAIINSQPYVDAMEFMKNAIWDWHIWANNTQAGVFYDQAGDPMGSGMVGMWEVQSWMGYAYAAWDKAFNWDAAAIPSVGTNKVISVTDADTFVIPKSSKHQKEAWEVIKWFWQNQYLKLMTDNYSCIPADKDLAVQWKAANSQTYPKVDFQVFLDALDYADFPNHEAWKPAYTKINDAMNLASDAVRNGENMDVKAVLDTANAEAQKLLDEYWASH